MKRSAEDASLLTDRPSAADPCSSDADAAPVPPHRVSIMVDSSASSISTTSSSLYRSCSTITDDGKVLNNSTQPFLTRFINALLLQRDGSLERGELTVDSSTGIIIHIRFDSLQPLEGSDEHQHQNLISHTVDCKGMILSPGFIDLQLNGAYGVDFSNGGSEDCDAKNDGLCLNDIFQVANSLCQTGVTSFCPTMVSSSRDTYRRVIPLMRRARREQQRQEKEQQKTCSRTLGMARILRLHLEGPFFDPSKRGAHKNEHILAPSKGIDTVREVYGLNQVQNENHSDIDDSSPMLEDIDIITLAPELDGALDATESLTDASANDPVVVSCGHTGASYEEGIQAISHGATLLTHLFNAMNPFHHRKPGLVGLLSSESKLQSMGLQRPYYSLIVDGIHVHESAVCMAYNSHPDGCVLVTDAMSAMGLGDGIHALGDMSVNIEGDRATLTGTETLAGSVVSMDTCVRRFQKFTACSIGEALLCATLHPANVLNRSEVREINGVIEAPIGVLEIGARADLVLLTGNLDVAATWVNGRAAYEMK